MSLGSCAAGLAARAGPRARSARRKWFWRGSFSAHDSVPLRGPAPGTPPTRRGRFALRGFLGKRAEPPEPSWRPAGACSASRSSNPRAMPRPRPPSQPLCLHTSRRDGRAILVLTMKPATDDPVLESLRYPVGRFESKSSYSAADVAEDLQRVEMAPKRLAVAVRGLTPVQLDTPYRPGGWSARRVVHHLADAIERERALPPGADRGRGPRSSRPTRTAGPRSPTRKSPIRALARGLRRRDDAPRDPPQVPRPEGLVPALLPSRVEASLEPRPAPRADRLAPRAPRRAHQLPALAGRVEGLNPSVPEE